MSILFGSSVEGKFFKNPLGPLERGGNIASMVSMDASLKNTNSISFVEDIMNVIGKLISNNDYTFEQIFNFSREKLRTDSLIIADNFAVNSKGIFFPALLGQETYKVFEFQSKEKFKAFLMLLPLNSHNDNNKRFNMLSGFSSDIVKYEGQDKEFNFILNDLFLPKKKGEVEFNSPDDLLDAYDEILVNVKNIVGHFTRALSLYLTQSSVNIDSKLYSELENISNITTIIKENPFSFLFIIIFHL